MHATHRLLSATFTVSIFCRRRACVRDSRNLCSKRDAKDLKAGGRDYVGSTTILSLRLHSCLYDYRPVSTTTFLSLRLPSCLFDYHLRLPSCLYDYHPVSTSFQSSLSLSLLLLLRNHC